VLFLVFHRGPLICTVTNPSSAAMVAWNTAAKTAALVGIFQWQVQLTVVVILVVGVERIPIAVRRLKLDGRARDLPGRGAVVSPQVETHRERQKIAPKCLLVVFSPT